MLLNLILIGECSLCSQKIPFHKSTSLLWGGIITFPTENRLWFKPTVVPAGKLGKPEQERRQLDSIAALDASDAAAVR